MVRVTVAPPHHREVFVDQYIDLCKIATQLIDKTKVQDRVKDLAVQLADRNVGEPVSVFWIANGAQFFAADLIREIGFRNKNLIPEMIRARSYYGTASGTLKHDADLIDYGRHRGRRIILLDDVLDMGQTLHVLSALIRDRVSGSDPQAVAFVQKEGCQKFDVPLAAVGFKIFNNPWLLGYGMDDNNHYRAEPGIWAKVIHGWPRTAKEVPVWAAGRPLAEWSEERNHRRRGGGLARFQVKR